MEDLRDLLSQFISDLSALRRWASREKLTIFEPLLGKELCGELSREIGDVLALLERVRRRVRDCERELGREAKIISEALGRVVDEEKYRLLIPEGRLRILREVRERIESDMSRYISKGECEGGEGE